MGITAQNVHNVAFSKPPIGKRGYHEEHVDELLDRIEAALAAREKGDPVGLTGADVRAARFGKPPIGKRGYHEDEVDRFLELVVLELDGPTPAPVAPTPAVEPGQAVLFASPATLERVIDMLRAESDLLAQWPAAAQAQSGPPSLSIYTVG